jgi:hypothetical protein
MSDDIRTAEDEPSHSVHIGDVEGGIRDAIIAGRDVIVYDGTRPVTVADLLAACKAQVESVLTTLRHKYDPTLYVNRALEHDLNRFLDARSPNCYLLVAPAGSGKTNLLCNVASERVDGQPVLLMMGRTIQVSRWTNLLGAIRSELQAASPEVYFRSAENALHTLHRLAGEMGRDALLLLDGIDESDQPTAMRRALDNLLRNTRDKQIKLVVTCRDYSWEHFSGDFWEGATYNALPSRGETDDFGVTDPAFKCFSPDESEVALDRYLSRYQIRGRPAADIAERLRHPLLLRFFCEAHHGQRIGDVESIPITDLLDRYWKQKLDSVAEHMIQQGDNRLHRHLVARVGDYLMDLAAYMLARKIRAVPLSDLGQAVGRVEEAGDPRSIYGRVRDEYIVHEAMARGRRGREALQVAFVHEEFAEYVMARALVRDWEKNGLDEPAIVERINELIGEYERAHQILAVMSHVEPMLAEASDIDLWPWLSQLWVPSRSETLESIQQELEAAQEKLALTQTPEEKHPIVMQIRRLKRREAKLRAITLLRETIKLLTGPVAEALTGQPWKSLRQQLLTHASKLPYSTYLDVDAMEAAAEDLARLIREVRTLLLAYAGGNMAQLAALERRAGILAAHIVRVCCLAPGDAPDLETLVARRVSDIEGVAAHE